MLSLLRKMRTERGRQMDTISQEYCVLHDPTCQVAQNNFAKSKNTKTYCGLYLPNEGSSNSSSCNSKWRSKILG